MVEYDTPMKGQKYIQEAKEQIQEDVLTYLEGYWAFTPYGEKMKTDLCQIIVDNFKTLEK
mgnify:CR=1 FL=1|jgi:hypothetical protein